MASLGTVQLSVAGASTACPICAGTILVQKTVHRQGRTLAHGRFEARETIHVCLNGCR
jgi:hypothetical protein